MPSSALPTPPVVERRGPSCWVKTVVSLLILLQAFAILTAVTSAGSGNFPAPSIIVLTKDWVTRPYLQFVFLTNPYRFYAPNPGPTPVLWLRLQYEDNSIRWLELPRRKDWSLRMPYQRHLCAVMLFDQMAFPVSEAEPGVRRLSNEGRIAACSYARYIARKYARTNADGSLNPVREIAMYNVMHQIIEPWMVQQGMDPSDVRLLMPFYVGTFGADGMQLDKSTMNLQHRQNSDLVAHILASDIYPLFRAHPDTDRSVLLDEIGAPPAIRALFYRYPQLRKEADMDRADLKNVIESLHGMSSFPADAAH